MMLEVSINGEVKKDIKEEMSVVSSKYLLVVVLKLFYSFSDSFILG